MSEVLPNSTTIGYLMTALHQKHPTTDFFSSAIALLDSPRDNGSENWAGIDDKDTTQN